MWRVAGAAVSVFFALPLLSFWRAPTTSVGLAAVLSALMAATLVRPASGLLVLAGLFPVAPAIAVLLGQPFTGEVLLLSFLTAAALNAALSPRAPDKTTLALPAVVLAASLISSAVLALSSLQMWQSEPRPFVDALLRHVTAGYFTDTGYSPLHEVLPWLEALALGVFAERIVRSVPNARRSLVRVFVFAGAALSASSAVRLAEVSLRRADPIGAAVGFLQRLRFNTYFPDVNAAGSIFALFLVAAIWLTWRRSRLWLPLAAALAIAVWLTGSRAAFGGVLGGLGVLWLGEYRPRLKTVVATGLMAGLALAVVTASTRRNASVAKASGFRVELMLAGFTLAAEHPMFGQGLNTFKAASNRVLPEEFKRRFAIAARGENAHNNYLQVLVELGIMGLIGFLALVAAPFRHIAVGWPSGPLAPETVALLGGVTAFLLSALLGHPLLDDNIRAVFFLALGVTTGLTASSTSARRAAATGFLAFVVLVVVASLPLRLDAQRRMEPLAGLVRGTSDVQSPLDGVSYRIAEPRSTWFLNGASGVVSVPLRARDDGVACLVDLAIDGSTAKRVNVTSAGWQATSLSLEPPSRPRSWRRLDIAVESGCTLLVGVPTERGFANPHTPD